MKTIKPLFTLLFCLVGLSVSAQNYNAKISRDSVAVLQSRLEVLKSSIKLNELKLNEAEQEAEIEKQKLKIVDLIGSEKAAAEESRRLSDALKAGRETDIKKVERMSKKAANSAKDVKNATEKLHKQIDKIEELRTVIQTEERKLANRTPIITYSNNKD